MDQKEIGTFIASLRKEKNLTQAQLGEKIGVTNKTISRWENGNYMPDIAVMPLLCEELDINVNELLSGKRLDDYNFRKAADNHLISSIKRTKNIKKESTIIDAFIGAGAGIWFSVLYSPDSMAKTVLIIAGAAMLGAGIYRKNKYDKFIIEQWGKGEV